ncbi:MAG: GNAT family N-acetyltransferase [Bacteroidia bacterium]
MQLALLPHHQREIAQEIWAVWQSSYRIEAALVGVEDFPPLRKTVEDIMSSPLHFVGIRLGERLAALAGYSIEDEQLEISNLVVDPAFFRQGLAGKLMEYLLAQNAWTEAIVDTAQVNLPAINLYQKWGFEEINRWLPAHGIPIVRLSRSLKA